MRSSTTLVLRAGTRRVVRLAALTRRPSLALALVCQSLLPAVAPPASAQKRINPKSVAVEVKEADAPAQVITPTVVPAPQDGGTGKRVTSVRVTNVRTAQVTFKGIEASERRAAAGRRKTAPDFQQEIHAPLRIDEVGPPAGKVARAARGDVGAGGAPADEGGPLVTSPAPSATYRAHNDVPKGGGVSGTVVIPPDTMGAVGLTKNLVMLNNNMVVQDKTTGAQLSLVSMDAFWAPTGATGTFDPRVLFDPYQQRWLVSAVSNASTANSSVLVGVSANSDPQGTFTLFRFVVGCASGAQGCASGGEWADFPMLGFNKNWVAVGWNQFTSAGNNFVAGKILVLNYPTLRTGTAQGDISTNASGGAGDFCMHPATTFSATEETLYVPAHQSSAGAIYRLHKITGTPAAPVFNVDATERVRPGGAWTQPGGDVLPQACTAPCGTSPATARGIDAGDPFLRSNVVFRNGLIYYPQSIGLPAGGVTSSTRFAVQWTALNPDGSFNTGGRVEDAAATLANGGRHYSYPSIAVNKNNDIMLGFSEFESDDNPDAGYTLRLSTDAAGTMRDPVIYKDGLGYYEKTFSGARNRWGDYSHTVVDPVNDRDMWTIQEVSDVPVGAGNGSGRWDTWWAKVAAPAAAGELLISEFRLRGPNGASDEFIEIYNNNNSAFTVNTVDGSAGYAVAAQDNVVRCTIPNGTTIPALGHYLCVNSVGYSLASYPAGNGTTAAGDATYTTDIPDNNGIAVFRSATTFDATTRLDSAGFTATPPSVYVEGTGIPALGGAPYFAGINHSFHRDACGKGGSATSLGACPTGGLAKDTNDNAADFIFADTVGTNAGTGQRLGAPGPENLSSPVQRNGGFPLVMVDASAGASSPPNRARDFASEPTNNSTFGTLTIRRRVVNNTGAPVTRLRFRVVDITTAPVPGGFADLRARTSGPTVISGINDAATCSPAAAPCTVTVQGTTLEEPPAQPVGGGFNSSLSAATVTLAQPLASGASVNVQFLLGIQQTGTFKFFVNVEALP